MLGRTNTGGGGGGLNFKVVPNPQPSTAKENTIWVDTDKINNYYFSATQPENMVEYDVWFPIGTSSTVAFSATKKNPVMVYPLSAKQHISGALVDKTAKSYQGGAWVDWWNGELYDAGNQFEAITGGWHRNTGLTMGSYINSGGTCTIDGADKMSVAIGDGASVVVTTENKIDVSKYDKIYFSIDANNPAYGTSVFVTDKESGNVSDVSLSKTEFVNVQKDSPVELNVSNIDVPVYVGFGVVNGRSYDVHRVLMK